MPIPECDVEATNLYCPFLLEGEGEYDNIDKRDQNGAIISLVHGNTNDFKEVHPHGYVSRARTTH
jgi:hypothetical protein